MRMSDPGERHGHVSPGTVGPTRPAAPTLSVPMTIVVCRHSHQFMPLF